MRGIRFAGSCYRVVSPLYIPQSFETLQDAVDARAQVMSVIKGIRKGQVVKLD